MFDSVRPHGEQPTRLLCPWDSPGKNTGMGCHFLLQCMYACWLASIVSDSVRPNGQQPTRLLCPQDSLSTGKNTGMGCHVLLQFMKVKSQSEVAQSCQTLCDPMDCSLPGSSVHGSFQARILCYLSLFPHILTNMCTIWKSPLGHQWLQNT